MMIVMFIISMVSLLIAINIRTVLKEQAFKVQTSQVLETITVAQKLMMITNVDSVIHFEEDQDKIFYWIEVKEPLDAGWKKEIERKRILDAIHFVNFDDNNSNQEQGKLELKFLSGGSRLPNGILRLSTSKSDLERGSLSRYIYFPGYLTSLKLLNKNPLQMQSRTEEDEQLDQEIVRHTIDELNAYDKRNK